MPFNTSQFYHLPTSTAGVERALTSFGENVSQAAVNNAARKKQEEEKKKLEAQMQMVTEYLADPKYKDKDGFVDASKIRTTAKSDLEPEAYQALMGEIDKMNKGVMEQDFMNLRMESLKDELAQRKKSDMLAERSSQLAYGDGSGAAYEGLSPEEQRTIYAMAMPQYGEYMDRRATTELKGAQARAMGAPEPEKRTAQEREIQLIMETYPELSRREAMDLQAGYRKIEIDPETGTPFLFNEREGTAKPLKTNSGPESDPALDTSTEPDAAGQSDFTMWDVADRVTGAGPWVAEKAQGVTGQIGVNVADPEIQSAKQTWDAAQRDLMRSMMVGDRYTASEMKMIAEQVNINPGALTDPQTLKARLAGLDRFLRIKLEDEKNAIENDELPVAARKAARTRAQAIEDFLQIMGVPENPTASPGGSVPAGVNPDDWEYMTPKERALWPQN